MMAREEEIKQLTANRMFAKLLNAFAKKRKSDVAYEKKQEVYNFLIEKVKKGKEVSAKTLIDTLEENSTDT